MKEGELDVPQWVCACRKQKLSRGGKFIFQISQHEFIPSVFPFLSDAY